jgi:hypothetical protein
MMVRVDRQVGGTFDEPGQFGTQSAYGGIAFVDRGLEVVLRDRLKATVGGIQQ